MTRSAPQCKERLTIVLYNYVQPNERNSPGGGVSVYLRNICASLRSAGHQVYVMSCGDRYSLLRRQPSLRKFNEELIVYNSPVIAPAIFSFHHPEFFLYSDDLNHIADQILDKLGSVDVFHFQNIEGLTCGFFSSLRKAFPRSAFIFSAHNYNIVCPQVNLWKNSAGSCHDFRSGLDCVNCSDLPDVRARKILINRVKTPFKDLGDRYPRIANAAYALNSHAHRLTSPVAARSEPQEEERPAPYGEQLSALYRAYRTQGVHLINHIFDQTIAVSARTADILISLGANASKIKTCYIGTKHAEQMFSRNRKFGTPQDLHVGFIGYMRKEKGFFFFLESLKRIPNDVKKNISVTIAAKPTEASAEASIKELAPIFRSFRLFDGYTHANLSDILEPVNLGIVPPLWEDNLPQVAIEFVAHGIPILTSNMGGAREIVSNENFVFDISDQESLSKKIQDIVDGKLQTSAFWNSPINIRSNEQHLQELISIYGDSINHCKQR